MVGRPLRPPQREVEPPLRHGLQASEVEVVAALDAPRARDRRDRVDALGEGAPRAGVDARRGLGDRVGRGAAEQPLGGSREDHGTRRRRRGRGRGGRRPTGPAAPAPGGAGARSHAGRGGPGGGRPAGRRRRRRKSAPAGSAGAQQDGRARAASAAPAKSRAAEGSASPAAPLRSRRRDRAIAPRRRGPKRSRSPRARARPGRRGVPATRRARASRRMAERPIPASRAAAKPNATMAFEGYRTWDTPGTTRAIRPCTGEVRPEGDEHGQERARDEDEGGAPSPPGYERGPGQRPGADPDVERAEERLPARVEQRPLGPRGVGDPARGVEGDERPHQAGGRHRPLQDLVRGEIRRTPREARSTAGSH